MPILPNIFHETEKESVFPNLFYEANITLIPKPDKESTNYKLIFLVNMGVKTYSKILANWLQPFIKGITHYGQAGFVHVSRAGSIFRNPYHGILLSKEGKELWAQPATWPNLQRLMLSDKQWSHTVACCVPRTQPSRNFRHSERMSGWPGPGRGVGLWTGTRRPLVATEHFGILLVVVDTGTYTA